MPFDQVDVIFFCFGHGKSEAFLKEHNVPENVKAFDALAGHVEAIERKAEALCRRQEDVSLKKWLDNQDVCDVLGISKRTLQTYREKGLLPFSRIRHKIFYKPEDVGKLLQSSHYPNTAAL